MRWRLLCAGTRWPTIHWRLCDIFRSTLPLVREDVIGLTPKRRTVVIATMQRDPDRQRLQDDLRGLVSGDVLCDPVSTQLYASDASIYQIRPLAVVRPRSAADISATVQYAGEHDLAIHPRGAGSGVAGESIGPGIVLDCSCHLRRITPSEDGSRVTVQAGAPLWAVNRMLSPMKRWYGPDPATRAVTTMGGVIATNASGSHYLRSGSARDTVLSARIINSAGQLVELAQHDLQAAAELLERQTSGPEPNGAEDPAVTANSTQAAIDRAGKFAARITRGLVEIQRQFQLASVPCPYRSPASSGYRLDDLFAADGRVDLAKFFAGTQGTLGILVDATLRTEMIPNYRGVVLLFFHRLDSATRSAVQALQYGLIACDVMDRRLLQIARESHRQFADVVPREAEAAMLIEIQGESLSDLTDRLAIIRQRLSSGPDAAFSSTDTVNDDQRDLYWALFRRVIPRQYRVRGNQLPLPFVEDIYSPPEQLPGMVTAVQNILKKYQATATVFAHAGHGQLHVRPMLDLANPADRGRLYPISQEIAQVVWDRGGQVGVEHPAGLSRSYLMPQQCGDWWRAMGQVKRLFDPFHRFNPGKLFGAILQKPDENLRPIHHTIEIVASGRSVLPASAKTRANRNAGPLSSVSESSRPESSRPGSSRPESSRPGASHAESSHRDWTEAEAGGGSAVMPAPPLQNPGEPVAETVSTPTETRIDGGSDRTIGTDPLGKGRLDDASAGPGPKKLVDSLLPHHPPPQLEVLQQWPGGTPITRTTRACNGCARCRAHASEERQCPMFRISSAEEASPRAKANLLRGVLSGQLPVAELTGDHAKAVADLCFNCHSCRVECPASVNIPKIVGEIKAQYVATNGMPLSDWLMGRIDTVAAIGSRLRWLTNPMLRNTAVRWILERTLGLSAARELPAFAGESFLRYASRRRWHQASPHGGLKVVYFVDQYANYHDPEIGRALAEILQHNRIGFYVPPGQAVSGMARITSGDLKGARKLARRNVRLLAEAVRQGYNVLATEPAAALCLKHEYPNLLDTEDAHLVAAHSHEACEYLWSLHEENRLALEFKPIRHRLQYHQPCHSRVLHPEPVAADLLRLIPELSVDVLGKGCSGMAGTWGLQRKNYRNSLRIGWPMMSAVRKQTDASPTSECSSCRMQMQHGGDYQAIHPLKLLAQAYGRFPLQPLRGETT